MKESYNCGPLVLYMLGILKIESYTQLKDDPGLCIQNQGTYPYIMQQLIEKLKSVECSWFYVNESYKTYIPSIELYLRNMSNAMEQREYATIILFLSTSRVLNPIHGYMDQPKQDKFSPPRKFNTGHYCILLYKKNEVYIIDPFINPDTCTTLYNCVTFNTNIKLIPIDEYNANWTDFLIFHEDNTKKCRVVGTEITQIYNTEPYIDELMYNIKFDNNDDEYDIYINQEGSQEIKVKKGRLPPIGFIKKINSPPSPPPIDDYYLPPTPLSATLRQRRLKLDL